MNVGDIITSQQTYHDLPVGSTVRGSYTWHKTGANQWTREGTNRVRDNNSLNSEGRVTIVAVGDGTVVPTTDPTTGVPVPGTALVTAALWQALPPGSIVGRNGQEDARYHFRRLPLPEGIGWENCATGDTYRDEQLSNNTGGQYIVVSVTEGATVPTYETPDKFMWLFHQVVSQAAENHGVPQSTVTDAIREIGHPVPAPAPGAEIRWQRSREDLPAGSIVYVGYPESPLRFGVFKKGSRGAWNHIMGPSKRISDLIHVDYVPGVDDSWALDPGSEETAKAAMVLRAKAWQVGIKVKHAHGWCGELEGILHRAGLSEQSIYAVRDFSLRVGSLVTPEQAAPLPMGTIFHWRDGDDFCFYKRVDGVGRNISRTRRVFGLRADGAPLRHFAPQMEVMALGDEPLQLGIDITQQKFSLIPPGSAWHFNGGSVSGPSYVMAHDHRAAAYQNGIPAYGTWSLTDLVGTQTTTRFTFTHLETP